MALHVPLYKVRMNWKISFLFSKSTSSNHTTSPATNFVSMHSASELLHYFKLQTPLSSSLPFLFVHTRTALPPSIPPLHAAAALQLQSARPSVRPSAVHLRISFAF